MRTCFLFFSWNTFFVLVVLFVLLINTPQSIVCLRRDPLFECLAKTKWNKNTGSSSSTIWFLFLLLRRPNYSRSSGQIGKDLASVITISITPHLSIELAKGYTPHMCFAHIFFLSPSKAATLPQSTKLDMWEGGDIERHASSHFCRCCHTNPNIQRQTNTQNNLQMCANCSKCIKLIEAH